MRVATLITNHTFSYHKKSYLCRVLISDREKTEKIIVYSPLECICLLQVV